MAFHVCKGMRYVAGNNADNRGIIKINCKFKIYSGKMKKIMIFKNVQALPSLGVWCHFENNCIYY